MIVKKEKSHILRNLNQKTNKDKNPTFGIIETHRWD